MITDPVRSSISKADKMFGVTTKTGSDKVRLRAGNLWLHWSGGFLTDNPKNAWTGTVEQARNCRAAFDAAADCRIVRNVNTAHKILEN
jgi:hypothetical protein